ncbi:pseudouridine synthase [Asaia lannensis]|uniref:Pseudouridine synthase n=1 Tax=Asaia lannensis NBRC 102526 TaxID=1307926 RepID=A0ABT1CH68_9PROT|nr:pseudouridine synthase [Asaia lannensis]MCO6160220.1 rRNA pseudouridine synthase [Asaia lannensis NBRC 102526]GBQ94691.1 tRNA/rRNA pseudouridine synthase [Asaia lannensis NBRC 102526]
MTEEQRGERIAKWMARAGAGSRRDIERMIEAGRIRMNGSSVEHPATFVQDGDIIQLDGKVIGAKEHTRVWRYHKPDGLMTTHRDPQGRPTVFDSLPEGMPRVVSVGRLDINSEGLLLLTNDGELARRLELPSNAWIRRYRVRVFGVVDERKLAALAHGSEFDGVRYGPIEAGLDSQKGDNAWLTVSLQEGKNREIRRVMMGLNLHVSRLIRVSYGPFQLGTLQKREIEEVQGKILREQIPGLAAAPRRVRRVTKEVASAASTPDAEEE